MANGDSGHKCEMQELQAVNRRLKQEIKLLKSSRGKRSPELIKSTSRRYQLVSQAENHQSPTVVLNTGLMQTADSDWQTQSPDEIMPACHVSITPGARSCQGNAEAASEALNKIQSPKKTVTWISDASQGDQSGTVSIKHSELQQQQVHLIQLQESLAAAEDHQQQQLNLQQQTFSQRLENLEVQLQQERQKRCLLEDRQAGPGKDVLELQTHLLAAQANEQALASQNAQQQQHLQQLQEQLLTTGGVSSRSCGKLLPVLLAGWMSVGLQRQFVPMSRSLRINLSSWSNNKISLKLLILA